MSPDSRILGQWLARRLIAPATGPQRVAGQFACGRMAGLNRAAIGAYPELFLEPYLRSRSPRAKLGSASDTAFSEFDLNVPKPVRCRFGHGLTIHRLDDRRHLCRRESQRDRGSVLREGSRRVRDSSIAALPQRAPLSAYRYTQYPYMIVQRALRANYVHPRFLVTPARGGAMGRLIEGYTGSGPRPSIAPPRL